MLVIVIVVGIAFIVGAAIVIGVDSDSRTSGWRNLAEERRILSERAAALAVESRELWEWEGQLIRAAESGRCPVCELRRLRGEHPGD